MRILLYLFTFLSLISCGVSKSVHHVPEVQQYALEIPKVQKINDSTFSFNQNYLTKNNQQIWPFLGKSRLQEILFLDFLSFLTSRYDTRR